MEDWDFNNRILHYFHLKKKNLEEHYLYLRWTSLLRSSNGSYWHLTLWNPMTHKCAHCDIKPSDVYIEELRGGLCHKDYIEWNINLMEVQVM